MENTLTYDRVKDIFQTFASDLTIQFDNGVRVEYFSNSLNDNQLIIMSRNKISYDLTVDGWIKENNDKHAQTLSQIDAFISKYSEECNSRWEKIISKCDDLECDSCFYFRQIDGHFYFWDYGICSNPHHILSLTRSLASKNSLWRPFEDVRYPDR